MLRSIRALSARGWPWLSRERGEGWALYLPWPNKRQPFVAVGLGFSGWQHDPGGRSGRFHHPYLHVGKAFENVQPWWSFQVARRVVVPERPNPARKGRIDEPQSGAGGEHG